MSATTMRSGNSSSSGGEQQQQRQPGKRNILSNAAYSIFNQSSNDYARHGPAATAATAGSASRRLTTSSSSYLQRSTSADNVQIVRQRGFKPSDRHDPAKRNFLESLTSKILHFDMDSGSSTPVNLQKLLTPATDSSETLHLRNKKMYASSYFYAPSHPTVEDQVELARRISSSLSDVKNVKSKGQSMYVNRKKRSVKWIHDGNGQEDEEDASAPPNGKDKVPLKCMMNPGGKLLDYHGFQALGGEDPNTPPPHPERLYDIVRDLNNQKGRGAEIFAKRRKRSEKWVVDAEQPQSPSIYAYGKYPVKQDIAGGGGNGGGVNEHLKFDNNKPFYNPYDLSMDYSSPVSLPNYGHQCSRASFGSAHSDCGPCAGCGGCGPCAPCSPYGPYPPLYPPPYGPSYGAYPPYAAPIHQEARRKKKPYPPANADPTEKLFRRASFDGLPRGYAAAPPGASNGHGHGRVALAPTARNPKAAHQPNGQQQAMRNGFNYLNGLELQKSPAHHSGRVALGNGYRNGNGCIIVANNACQHQRSSGYQPAEPSPNDEQLEDDAEQPVEDYTPVPVKQLIQEFEKTCRPIMQFRHYPSAPPPSLNPAAGAANGHGDLSRYFDSRRQVCYRRAAEAKADQQRAGNGYAHSSAGDDEQDDDENEDDFDRLHGLGGGDDDDDDDDASLDDSLSPVDFYRAEPQTNGHGNNRSSSMSTIDDYYRRQMQQAKAKYVDTEAEPHPGVRAANLAAAVSQSQITAQRKDLKKTPVLENLVAGTTTPECFKETFTEDIASKLDDNLYHGPKISSYQNLTNYNTAPRGWSQSQTVYRPIRFEKPQDTKISYSDF